MIANVRIAGLDNWRAGLMLAGILLHATSVQEVADPLFIAIGDISSNFRMGAFFAVSGLLSIVSAQRRGSEPWLGRRLFQIGIPTISGLLFICPLMSSIYTWRVQGHFMPAMPSISWWHIWFLVALLLYAPITYIAGRLDEQRRVFSRVNDWALRTRVSSLALILTAGLCSYMLACAHRALAGTLGQAGGIFQEAILISTYAPLYLAGVMIGGVPGLFRKLTGEVRAPLIVLFTLAAMMLVVRASMTVDRAALVELHLITTSFCPPAMAVLILRSAASMSHSAPFLARISEAAFTIYIVHYPITMLLDIAIDPLRLHPYLAYLLTVVLAAWLSYALHFSLVRRSRLAALLLNGRAWRPRRAATT